MTDKRENGKKAMMDIPSVLKLIVAVFFLATLPVQIHALTPDQVFDKVKDSVVVVKTLDAQGNVISQGSGVLLPSGKIATNCHVVEGGVSFQVGSGEKFISATLYAKDEDKDIGLLDAKGIKGKPAQIGKAASLKVGVPVYAVGAPMGLELSISDGIVSQLRGGPPPLIQTTTAISPGSSGGGLFDGDGRLVGLTTRYIEGGQSLNFAMPVELIGDINPGRKTTAEGRSQPEWLKRASALEELKDWQELLDWCRKWTKSEPLNAHAWGFLGVTYSDLERHNDAIEAYRHALRINPKNVNVWSNLGITYNDLKRYDDAIEAYRHALRISPEHYIAWNNLGSAYTNRERYKEGVEALHHALHLNPEFSEAWFNLGYAYGGLERNNEAIEAFRHALSLNPKYVEAWAGLIASYIVTGNRTAALDALKELRRLDPEKAEKLFNIIVPH